MRGEGRSSGEDGRDQVGVAAGQVDRGRRSRSARRDRGSPRRGGVDDPRHLDPRGQPERGRAPLERPDARRGRSIGTAACGRCRQDDDADRRPVARQMTLDVIGSDRRRSTGRRPPAPLPPSRASRKGSSPARYSPPPWSPIGPVIGSRGVGQGRKTGRVDALGARHRAMIRGHRQRGRRAYDDRPMPVRTGDLVAGIAAWTRRWDAILPLLAAELIVWLGFGALLPIMPLYFTEHGVDLATLGVVVAAWPAARLIGEPIFGWVADRTRRVPLMVAGNVARRRSSCSCRSSSSAPAPFIDPAGPRRARDRDVRPGGPRLHHRRHARRTGAARRSGCTARRRWAACCSGPAIGGLGAAIFGGVGVHLRLRRDQLVPRGRRDRDPGPRAAARRRAHPGDGADRRRSDLTEFPARARALLAGDRRGEPPTGGGVAAAPAARSPTACSSRRSSSPSAATSPPGRTR